MDTTKTTTHVSLCAGYGGIDLGLSRAIPNLRTIAFSEIEAFACANLVAKMEEGLLDAAPIWTNLKTFPWSEFRDRVDILSGGYPCQPFSAAGKRLGRDDPRHLWPWIADGIVSMRPRVCFFENVEGHISLGLREVISELEGLGYQTTWGIFSAREVGAPHQRKRVFIMAYDKIGGLERLRKCSASEGWTAPLGHVGGGSYLRTPKPIELADTVRDGSGEGWISCKGSDGSESFSNGESWGTWPSRPGQPQHGWEPPRVVGNAKHDGLPTESILRGDETTGNEWGKEEPQQAGQLEGADRSSDVPSLQRCTSGSESMGDTSGWSNGQQQTEQQGWDTSGRSGEESGAMGDSETWRRREGGDETCERQGHRAARSSGSDDELSQAQPTLGGDSDGSADWLGHAELFVTSDNRTDELRLLGNGVVPATATRAFLTLMDQLLNENA